MTLTEIPPSSEFAEKEGEDGVSLDQTTAEDRERSPVKLAFEKHFVLCVRINVYM